MTSNSFTLPFTSGWLAEVYDPAPRFTCLEAQPAGSTELRHPPTLTFSSIDVPSNPKWRAGWHTVHGWGVTQGDGRFAW
jgi:hypothetical protein